MTHTRLVRNMTIGGAAAAALTLLAATPASAETTVPEPDRFTSAFTVMATPDQVLNADGVATPGEPGATGRFDLRLDSASNTICYDITLTGVTGEYQSPAKTATHIHQAAVGKAGPPRIAFPNPVDAGDGTRTSSGCMQGPFTTGVAPDGKDTGEGFTVAQIEADPSAFAADTHTASFTAGAVRGQLTQVPVGGVDTGAGGSATSTSAALPLVAG
ncbi:CHRD domain-containing protein, partial [Clavibacter lycopersici]